MSCLLAGSAIKQGRDVGRIDRWSKWKPAFTKTSWLLIAGASNPPSCIKISTRRTRNIPEMKDGEFLYGSTYDLGNMEAAVKDKLFNSVKDLTLSKSAARDHIQKFFHQCRDNKVKPVLYYTGHGENGTGNWCFVDGKISIEEILDMLPEECVRPMILSDTCYSGHWANFCLKHEFPGFTCLAACPEFSKALDTKDKGGDFTLFMTGKISRPRTEPLYSERNRNDYPITHRYDSAEYHDFINSHLFSSQDILISQSFNKGHLSCIFALSIHYLPRPAFSCAILNDYASFSKLVNKNSSQKDSNGKSKQIYSLACDENLGFAVFFLTNYGTAQTIVTNISDVEKKMKAGFKITACTAQGPEFYIIMTKGTKEYKGKQKWFTPDSWDEAKRVIQDNRKERKIITDICYSTGQRKYLVVATETTNKQVYRKFRLATDLNSWVEDKHTMGFQPTIIFKDPADNKILAMMINDGSKRPLYTCKYDFKVNPEKS